MRPTALPGRLVRKIRAHHAELARPTVVQETGQDLRILAGEESLLQAPHRGAVVAAYAPNTEMTRSLHEYVRQLGAAGYVTLIILTGNDEAPRWPAPLPDNAVVATRPNIGYDFGSWAVALHRYPGLRRAQHTLLTNDSMIGPFADIAALLTAAQDSRADLVSATDSFQISYHLQSFFVMFNRGVLDDEPWRHFYSQIRTQKEKMDVVRRYELGIARLATREAYPFEVLFPGRELGAGAANPTLAAWNRLLGRGFPFVKRTIITDPTTAPGGQRVGDVVAHLYATNINDWL